MGEGGGKGGLKMTGQPSTNQERGSWLPRRTAGYGDILVGSVLSGEGGEFLKEEGENVVSSARKYRFEFWERRYSPVPGVLGVTGSTVTT